MPHFKSYYYLKTKVYGWACAEQYFSPLNGLFQTDFVLFNQNLDNKLPKYWQDRLKEIEILEQGEDVADQVVLEARRVRKETLENKKNALRKSIRDYKEEQKRLAKEEKARRKAEAREARRRAKEEAERQAREEN